MRTLEELRSMTFPIPSYFSDEDIPTALAESNNQISFPNGFTSVTSKNPIDDSNGEYILQQSMNQFGAMATREKLFRDAGGIYSYDPEINGYPKGIILFYDDGKYIRMVESLVEDNTAEDFAKDIDVFIKKSGQSNYVQYWKSVGNPYSAAQDEFHIKINFSNIKRGKIPSGQISINSPSLCLLGASFYSDPEYEMDTEGIYEVFDKSINEPFFHIAIDTHDSSINIDLENKGVSGIDIGYYDLVYDSYKFPYPLYGAGNFSEAYFLKTNTLLDVSIDKNNSSDWLLFNEVIIVPIRFEVN